MKLCMCITCGYLFEQNQLHWDALPGSWQCPECGQTKENFDMVEVNEAGAEPSNGGVAGGANDDPPVANKMVPLDYL